MNFSSKKEGSKTYSFPPVEAWDDFLDFTRMKLPAQGREIHVMKIRLNSNTHFRFKGNYISLTLGVLFFSGLFWSVRILVAFFLSIFSWYGLCYLTHWDEAYDVFHHKQKIVKKEHIVRKLD